MSDHDELRRRVVRMQDVANGGGVYGASGHALISRETLANILALLDEIDALERRVFAQCAEMNLATRRK